MGRLHIDQLKPGMVLGGEVRDYNGRFLLGKGDALTEKNLRVLKIWGITEAEIEGLSQESVESEHGARFSSEIIKQALQVTRNHFCYSNKKHPFIQELFRLCSLRTARQFSISGHNGNPDLAAEAEIPDAPADSGRRETAHISMQQFLSDEMKLPSLPHIFIQIQDVINNPRSSARTIADVISKDTSLAARLLKLVNSAFYGFPSRIDSLSRAVTIVGTKQLTTLALGITIISIFKNIPENLISLEPFWKHSIACGVVARILAKYKNISNTERLFVGGLLHDIGRMITYAYLPEYATEALMEAARSHSLLLPVERDIMGFTHADVGASLLNRWKLPVTLESMVRTHHNPKKSPYPVDSAIVHLSDVVVNALGTGSSGERFVPAMDAEAWEIMCLPVSILGPAINQLDYQLNDIVQYFFADD